MWPRKRIDIGWSDLFSGAINCLSLQSHDRAMRRAEDVWSSDGRAFACLSVRSGLDILLRTLDLPEGSEVLVSAINIGDMIRVVEHHGLHVVPVDVHREDVRVQTELLEGLVTPKTKAILVAQLMGTRMDLSAVVEFATQHDLLVIEDCAQAFEGDRYRGDDDVDVSMFSFGPIKTATALGGALFRVRDDDLRNKMREVQAGYPMQSRLAFLRRILFYCVLWFLGIKPIFGMFVRACRLFGADLDGVLNNSISNFSDDSFFDNLRHQPSVPLLALMTRRVLKYPDRLLDDRTRLGSIVSESLTTELCPGGAAEHHSYWLAPVQVSEPDTVVAKLRQAGFDSTADNTMRAVKPTDSEVAASSDAASEMLENVVYLPIYPGMPESEVRRMVQTIESA